MLNKITVVHVGNVNSYPPVISLIENMIDLNCKVCLICGTPKENIVKDISCYQNVSFIYIEENNYQSLIKKIERNSIYKRKYKEAVIRAMQDADVLWTTTDVTVKILGDLVLKYRHVMQLMELIEYIPRFGKFSFLKVPIDKYARNAWKVVVPQIDRAYIQKTWWNLKNVPYVLPNKPYRLDYGNPTDDMNEKLNIMKNEKRKIILYLGVIGADRNLDKFASAVQNNSDYALYLIGRAAYGQDEYLNDLLKNYSNIVYLGFFNPPNHLYFLQEAYIGILPYITKSSLHYSVLNAQYCAPNKIYEYAGFGVPVIGTDVLGLKRPLETYKLGVVVNEISSITVSNAIKKIDSDYSFYRDNCLAFSRLENLNLLLSEILE